jgi:Cu-processing system permease protein
MKRVLHVAADLLREAASRKWFLALGIGITLVLAIFGLGVRLDVVNGALAASRFFGRSLHSSIQSVDVAMRPVFEAVSYGVFYGGLVFGVLACSDFGPSLLAPGRIEQLLALPIRRVELLVGTYLGVVILACMGAVYGAGGFVVIVGLKTGAWSFAPVVAALLASVAFATLYAGMLTVAVFVRSAALSAATGGLLFIAGIFAGYRTAILPLFQSGVSREAFRAATALFPRLSTLANAGARFAASEPIPTGTFRDLLIGCALFGFGVLAIGAWRLEQRDF